MNTWPKVPLGELLFQVERKENVIADKEYSLLGVRLEHAGPFLRENRIGTQIAASKLSRVQEGDFIYSRLFAWRGAFGIIDAHLNGCYVSNEFPTFRTDDARLEKRFLAYWFRLKPTISAVEEKCTGSTPLTRNRFKEEFFLALQIPLPPLSGQRRLVERIDALAAKIEEAKGLTADLKDVSFPTLVNALTCRAFRGEAVDNQPVSKPANKLLSEIKSLTRSSNGKVSQSSPLEIGADEMAHDIPPSWTWARLGDLCYLITDGTHLTPRYVEDGRPFLSAQNIKPFRFMPDPHRKVSEEAYQNYVARVKPEKGDILMTRVGAMIGEAALIDKDIEFAFYVSLCLIKPVKNHLFVPYLLHWLNSPYGAAKAKELTLGKGHSQGNLNLNLIRRFPLPFPPLETQKAIVAYLEALRTRADQANALRGKVLAELQSMLPAILDKAFKGELQ